MKEIDNCFKDLLAYKQRFESLTLRDLFVANPDRFADFSVVSEDILFDYSRQNIDAPALAALLKLAEAADIEGQRRRLFNGEEVNFTEQRPALHTALRSSSDSQLMVDGVNITSDIIKMRRMMAKISDNIRSGEWRGATGKRLRYIVNIGTGGSGLGPQMVCQALSPYNDRGIVNLFVANVDPADIADTIRLIDLERSLFIISSKSFTTVETMLNATKVRDLIISRFGQAAIAKHFIAVTVNSELAHAFGLDADHVLPLWSWVGGRFSIWSAVGLPVAIAVGYDNFIQFLRGAEKIDQHFLTAPLAANIPVLMAVLGIWQRNLFNRSSLAILPYDSRLAYFAPYLQQLEMESNGKTVSRDGDNVTLASAPVIWGEPGTNGQHAFYQCLHQGSDVVPVDFLVAANSHDDNEQHQILLANCIAQAAAFAYGRNLSEVKKTLTDKGMNPDSIATIAPHQVLPGNKPASLLIYSLLDPQTLGKLIAIYEHKVFVQGLIWQINSFDQWGVEFGKDLALDVTRDMASIIDGAKGNGRQMNKALSLVKHSYVYARELQAK